MIDSPSSARCEEDFAAVTAPLVAAKRIGILTHRRPDGDAIGSCLAMAEALREEGKTVTLVNEDPVPASLSFLSGTEAFRVGNDLKQAPVEVDCLLVLDSAGKDRVGDSGWDAFRNLGPVVNVDHHVSNTRFGEVNYVDVESPATGQIVYELIQANGWALTDSARDALYVAISTDTGSFRYPSTGGDTYRTGADLIDAGLDLGRINQHLYENYPIRRLYLLRDLLQDMEVSCGGRAIAVKLTRAMAESAGMAPGDTEGLIDVIRSVDSVIVAVFFEEMNDGKIRVSSRSKSDVVDVGQICAVFGGGGHRLAAGARMRGPIEVASARFMNEVAKRLDGIG